MSPDVQVAGLLLCRAAGNRLAFPAAQVVTVVAWQPGEPFPHARQAFAEHAERGRMLMAQSGDAVAVDLIEVFQEPVPVMPPPALLSRMVGGSLAGFVLARQELWPLLRIPEFSRFLTSLPPAHPPEGSRA